MSEAAAIRTINFPVARMQQLSIAVLILLTAVMICPPAFAQGDPRSNVNVVGMTPDPADFPDRRYRQQNEPACAIRPGDSACIICAYNDYRAVDTDIGFGDSWEGVSQSCDAGDTWLSRLAPGHPLYEPVANRIPAEFAADPRLAAIPGMAIFNFIAGYRDSNVGVLAIQHWLEVNKEDADFYEPGRQTYIADEGTSGRFLDKPDMLAVLDGGQNTIELTTIMENSELGEGSGVITREFPTGTLYVAYAAFTGSNSIKVLVKVSHDWGRTFKNQALKLSEDQNQVSGISLTALGNKVLAVWRRKGDGNDVDSIMYSVISNEGRKATKGEVLADVCAFDQPTLTGTETDFSVVTFRTNDFPWTANDGENVFVFYSDRGRDDNGACLPEGKPRIVMHHSTLSGQANWTDYGPIDQTATPNTFQFMPTAFGANGKVQVAWYDTRRDPRSDPLDLGFVADYDAGQFLVNRTVDVFTTNITMNGAVPDIPDPVRASQFSILVDEESGTRTEKETEALFANKKLFAAGNAPFLGDYIAMAAREYRRNSTDTAWESNASVVENGNEDFFVAWTDNRDVRGLIGGISEALNYSYNQNASANLQEEDSDEETDAEQLVADIGPPRDSSMIAEGLDGSDVNAPGTCTVRSRDSNVYGSLIKDRARIYAPNPTKPLSGLQRAFPVVLSNSDEVPKNYTLKIIPSCTSPGTCQASFRQQPVFDTPLYDEPPLQVVDPETGLLIDNPEPFIIVPAKSSIARTVFVAGDQDPVKVEARDDTGTLLATIQLANAPRFRDPENCDPTTSNCSVASNELHNLELKTVDVHLLDLLWFENSVLDALLILQGGGGEDDVDASSLIAWVVAGGCCEGENPASLGSVIQYAVENLDENTPQIDAALLNAALLNAALLNANLLNASLLNANLLNANLLNANLLNSNPTDLTGLDDQLVTLAEDGGCCDPPLVTTYGDVIIWHISNPEFINADLLNANLLNAALLNANLLNANLLNANLLNANLLNANLLNANLLNANLLNASLLNAALLNPDVEAAALLNANLLNADLLNANLLNPTMVELAKEGDCCEDPDNPTAVEVIIYAVGHPEVINASLLNASLLNANLLNANLLNANLLNANLLNANLLNANLLNADLLNANLLNANLLNADLLNANLLNANLLNSSLTDITYTTDPVTDEQIATVTVTVGDDNGQPQAYTGDVTFDDYTYPITNNGNVTTAIDADITINAPTVTVTDPETGDPVEVLDVIGTKLIIWTTNATPTVVDCVERVQLNTRVQSITSADTDFEVADINNPFKGQASAVVAPGETVFVTLRVAGTKNQLKKVRVNGFTASSQSANCITLDNGQPFCFDQLNEGVEQITFQDIDPPAAPVIANITTEATSPAGATVSWSYFAVDAAQSAPILADCNSISGLSSGSAFPIGVTTVSCTATDFSGNTSAESIFTITVEDTTSPVITVNDGGNPIVFTANGPEGAWVDLTDIVTASDFGVPIPVACSTTTDIVLPDLLPPGDHTVICTASDGSSVEVSVQITIDVVDIEAPVLTVPATAFTAIADPDTGTASVNYSASVSAFDNVDLDITIVCDPPSGSTFPIGDTTVSCTASDDGPNEDGIANTDTETFVVTVNDSTAPVISLIGGASITLEAGVDSYTELGATVTDAGDLTVAVITGGATVDPDTVGTYVVTYDAIDLSGNAADQVTRTVIVEDSTAPIITLLGVSPVTVEVGGTYTDAGATAADIGDGDITASIAIVNPVDTAAVGSYTVTYDVTDSSTNTAAQVTRTVNVTDTTGPVIILVGAASITLEAGVDSYAEQGATVTDAGDLTVAVITGGDTVDPSTVGTYIVTFTAIDAFGNAATQVIRTVNVTDTTAPVITPAGAASITLEAGVDSYTEQGATVTDDGDSTVTVVTGGDTVDPTTVGTYVVTYDATDAAGNAAAQVTRTVTVQDTIAPVITVPTSPLVITTDTSPTLSGEVTYEVSVLDAGDPDTVVTCVPASGDAFVWGDTEVTCNATDGSDNAADSAVFTVTVRYLYDIEVIVSKTNVKLGSTIPIDWQYLDWSTRLPVDSSEIDRGITWDSTTGCDDIDPTGISGEDSGSSAFRYSSSSDTWQYSLQTKNLVKGKYLVAVTPPGSNVVNARVCVTLR